MKTRLIFCAVAVIAFGLYAFNTIKLGAIMGQVAPVASVNSALLVSGADTLKVLPVQGIFKFTNLKQGVYSLIIKGNAPYKDFVLKNVAVKDSATTNVGKIVMQP
ncbi:carboxypeptidase regulatory-like domain-containing protein [Pedobacter changchengzhani]|uniref:Carboxypeptidase regulatory-like domain-containing protein n=1 Tax=Pedobacter changchengzhani TaxID=2529274 RepID=A0A4V3A0H2_9SPHI|nr:carboxypeptidase regulatory-like domain-containing protein [Pedobacter changchengzhani]TDG37583.1 carboxypeptidase regulatory-like domain-containing protein [Pedobacter changchengzhani]